LFSRNLFFKLKYVMDPVKFDRAIRIIEVCGLTLIFLHPTILVAGRYISGAPNPGDIIIPNFSTAFYVFIASGCIAFWMIFIAGVIFLNRNMVRINKHWKYSIYLLYPAFYLSLNHSHAIGTSASYPLIDMEYHFLFYLVSFSIIVNIIHVLLTARSKHLRELREKRTPRKTAI
jgi:hypothetical protein